MSWHKPYRTTLLHQAVLISLLGTTSLAHAVTLGQANITSAQHEPLSATIEVSDIDAKNFNASLATPDIYQQMGLSADTKISVKFTPTSATTGRITLSSNTPISAPFADVVLNLNNNGEQVIEPQTLLMPLPSGGSFNLDAKTTVVNDDSWQNLPVTSPDAHAIDASQPPSVPMMPPVNAKKHTKEAPNAQKQVLTEQVARRQASTADATLDNFDEAPTRQDAKGKNKSAHQNTEAVYVVQSGDSLWSIANQLAKANNMSVGEVMKEIHTANPDAFNHGKMNRLRANASLNLPNYQVIPSQKAIEEAINAKKQQNTATTKVLAKKVGKKASTHNAPKAPTPKPSPSVKAQAYKPAPAPKPKALPRAQVTLVTPSAQGKATGTNTKPVSNATTNGSTGTNQNLVGTLKNTRQQTAESAKRVNGLNQELSTATAKLQLQNQKLAELEARLKALKAKP